MYGVRGTAGRLSLLPWYRSLKLAAPRPGPIDGTFQLAESALGEMGNAGSKGLL